MVALGRLLIKIVYLLQETFLGIRRGGWLNWAAVSTLMVLLFLVGISLELSWGLDATMESLGTQVEISAYLDHETRATDLETQISQIPHVQTVKIIAKEDAWRDLLVDMGIVDPQTVNDQLGDNPLVDAIRVQSESAEHLGTIAEQIRNLAGIDAVYYGDQVVFQLEQLKDTLRLGTLAVTGILSLTTVAVITTTIRLVVMASRREIEVMQLVGATSIWIYMPFILQGSLFGILGSSGAWGLVLGSQQVLQDILTRIIALPFLKIPQASSEFSLVILPVALGGMGLLLGTTSSLIAVRKSTLQ